MRQKHLDLVIALLVVAVNGVWIFVPDRPLLVTLLFGLPLIFLISGYTLTEALFTPKADASTHESILRPFGRSDRLIMSLGLSVALLIIDGLILNLLPIGLTQAAWVISLAIISTVFALIALYRRRALNTDAAVPDSPASLPRITFYEGLLFLLTIGIVTSAILYSVSATQQQQQQATFTQFWMVQEQQTNHSCAILLGVQSFETATTNYKVVLTANGSPLQNWPAITLVPKQEWYQSVTINSPDIESVSLDAQLYRLDKPETIYHETHLVLHNAGSGNGGKLVC